MWNHSIPRRQGIPVNPVLFHRLEAVMIICFIPQQHLAISLPSAKRKANTRMTAVEQVSAFQLGSLKAPDMSSR